MNDNTSDNGLVEASGDINDQNTLDQALANEPVTETIEPTEETELQPKVKAEKSELPEPILGKYRTREDAEKAFTEIQATATKAQQELAELRREKQAAKFDQFKDLEYADKEAMNFTFQKIQELEDFRDNMLAALQESQQQQVVDSSLNEVENFIEGNELLRESGLDEEFKLIATHPSMQEYTLESIYESRIRPKIEKLMGKKIRVTERGVSNSTAPERSKNLDEMSMEEYEASRTKLLQGAGIKGIK